MKKKDRFLNKLESKLSTLNKKDRQSIIDKYSALIDQEKEKGRRIVDILKELGSSEEIANNEIKIIKKNKKSIFKIIFDFINGIVVKIKKFLKKVFSKKNNKKIKIENNKEKNIVKDKKSLKDIFKKFKRDKKTKKDKKIEKTILKKEKEINVSDEVKNISLSEEKIIYKEDYIDNRKFSIKILHTFITSVLVILWFWVNVIGVSSLFAILDGIKFYGVPIFIFGAGLLILILIFYFNKKIVKKSIRRRNILILVILSTLVMAIGVGITIKDIYNIKITDDINEKYNMSKKEILQQLPEKPEDKLHISFNSNYKTKHDVQYVNNLDGKIKIEIKYYECYYDYYTKKQGNNIYISLKPDKRDRLSVYIADLKEGKVYNNDEFERYILTIKGSKKDLERVIID